MAEATFVLASIKQGGDVQSVAFVNGEFYSGTGKFDNGGKIVGFNFHPDYSLFFVECDFMQKNVPIELAKLWYPSPDSVAKAITVIKRVYKETYKNKGYKLQIRADGDLPEAPAVPEGAVV